MVGRLVELVQYPYVAFGERCRREYGIAEVVFCDYLATAEGE